jgi:hypothetical protein
LIVYLLTLEIVSGRRAAETSAEPALWARLVDHLLALTPSLFLLSQYPWDALLAPTTAAGGDMASLYYPTKLLAEEIMPRWQPAFRYCTSTPRFRSRRSSCWERSSPCSRASSW